MQAAAIAAGKNPGKAKKHLAYIGLIELRLMPAFGATPLKSITSEELLRWAAQQTTMKGPNKGRPLSWNDLNNIDTAFSRVWRHAAATTGLVSPKRGVRPSIAFKTIGRKPSDRPFFRDWEIAKLAKHINPLWDAADLDAKLHLLYPALLCATGIRPGLEMLSMKISQFRELEQYDAKRGETRPTYVIGVLANQGKHPHARTVTVYRAMPFPIIKMIQDVIALWRATTGSDDPHAADHLPLFGPTSLMQTEVFRYRLVAMFKEIGILHDPETHQARCPYSLRHYFATAQLANKVDVYRLSKWMGTSIVMIKQHYDRFIQESDANELDGF